MSIRANVSVVRTSIWKDLGERSIEFKLVESAHKVKSNSYSPYSKFPVGAALLVNNNEIITGINVENASPSNGCCAEKCAVLKAVTRGVKIFKALALTTNYEEFVWPCGSCLQFLGEFCHTDLPIYSMNSHQVVKQSSFEILYPKRFHLL